MPRRMRTALAIALTSFAAAAADAGVVFHSDFEEGMLRPEFTAPGAAIEPVQGYEGVGNFSGNFLRYTDMGLLDTTLTLTNLPPHEYLTLEFLLAIIDSWDGTEVMQVRIDGNLLFSHWFQIATGDSSSYVAPPGALLSSGTSLGFTTGGFYDRDRAYDLSFEPAFRDIPHTADSVTITWSLDAVAGGTAEFWQGGTDESWAIDDVTVIVHPVPVPAVDGTALWGLALALVAIGAAYRS